MLASDFILTLKVRRFILGNRVVGNGLFGPRFVFLQVVATALLSDVDETCETIILKYLVTLFNFCYNEVSI